MGIRGSHGSWSPRLWLSSPGLLKLGQWAHHRASQDIFHSDITLVPRLSAWEGVQLGNKFNALFFSLQVRYRAKALLYAVCLSLPFLPPTLTCTLFFPFPFSSSSTTQSHSFLPHLHLHLHSHSPTSPMRLSRHAVAMTTTTALAWLLVAPTAAVARKKIPHQVSFGATDTSSQWTLAACNLVQSSLCSKELKRDEHRVGPLPWEEGQEPIEESYAGHIPIRPWTQDGYHGETSM